MPATCVIAVPIGDPGTKVALVCTNGAKSDSRVIAYGDCDLVNSETHALRSADS